MCLRLSVSLSLSSVLENRKTEHSHRLEEQFRGEGSFKKAFQLGQHPLLYFAHFVCAPPLSVPPSLLILLFRSAFLPIFLSVSTRWRTTNNTAKEDKRQMTFDCRLLFKSFSFSVKGQTFSVLHSKLLGVTVCVSEVRDYSMCVCVAFLKGFRWNRCTCGPLLNYWKNEWKRGMCR